MIELAWWHWLVLGLVLVMAEIALPAFFLVWFGLGALVVALLTLVLPLSGTGQVVAWTVASLALVMAWFRYFKPRTKTFAGSSDAQIVGEIGLLTRDVEPFSRGEVRFQKPLAGSDTWTCIADEKLAAGERVRVLAVEGNLLRIGRR